MKHLFPKIGHIREPGVQKLVLDGRRVLREDLHLGLNRFTSGTTVVDPNATHQMWVVMTANQDILIDGTTNKRQIDTGVMRFEHTPAIDNTRCITFNIDTANRNNTHACVVNYDTTQLVAGETGSCYDCNVDNVSGSAGVVRGFEMSMAGPGSAEAHMLHADPGVIPLSQFSGTFGNVEKAWEDDGGFVDRTAAFNAAGTDVQIFANDNAIVYIGMAAIFDEIEVNLAIHASGGGIQPTFEFSAGGSSWTTFTPVDETQGFRQSAIISWFPSDIGTWATDTVNGTANKYWIRITRTRNSLSTPPTEDTVQVAATNEYGWDENGDITANSLTLASGATPTEFSTDGTLAGDSDVAVPTEKAVKTYVDALHPTSSARAYLNAAQAHTPTGTWVVLGLNAENWDLGSEFNTGTYRFTATVSGYYQVNGGIDFASNSVGFRGIGFHKNGVGWSYGSFHNATSGSGTRLGYSDAIFLAADDYVQLVGYQNSGANLNFVTGTALTHMSVHRLL